MVWVSAMSACVVEVGDGDESVDDVDTTAQELLAANGVSINGVSINGVSINGVSASGLTVGASGISVVSGGTTKSGAALVNATFTGTLASGATQPLRITAATLLPDSVWSYHLEAKNPTSGLWVNACPGTADAIAYAGRWDERDGVAGAGGWIADATKFSFACRGASVAKCIEFGYAPWKTVGGVLLRNHHQACVRMLRGDYCGDGHPWTETGTTINFYDALAIQVDAAAWKADAEWTAAGARCIDKARVFNKPTDTTCIRALKEKGTCGTSYGTGVLLIDEYKP
jgi:hypothetical protein